MNSRQQRILYFIEEHPGCTGLDVANHIGSGGFVGGLRRAQSYVDLATLQRDGYIKAWWDQKDWDGDPPPRFVRRFALKDWEPTC